ncbi:hypothetical protein [Bacillus sonorensis]|uniref:hypothetical protein n=1 Tax=Bacillus sonorensis TaxID=119858 RepID=UPI0012681085|nr:hypothetical protein [Bacillus sonorensis]
MEQQVQQAQPARNSQKEQLNSFVLAVSYVLYGEVEGVYENFGFHAPLFLCTESKENLQKKKDCHQADAHMTVLSNETLIKF